MNDWTEVTLGSRCEIFSGYPFKSAQFSNDPDDVVLIKGENVGQGEILWGISKRWPREQAEDFARFRLQSGDVVLAMDRPWVPAGLKYARVSEADPEALLVQRVARLRATSDLDQRFLQYVIGAPGFVAYIKNVGRGVGVPHISGKQIADYRFRLPPKRAQERIAAVLSAYDDLIENSRRRMTLLEEATRQLYREWFVRLRFPGHEHTRVTNGLPEGWERRRVRELAQIHRGKSYRSSELVDTGGRPFANLKCIERFGGFRVSGIKRFVGDCKQHQVARPGDILIAVTDLTRDAMVVSRAARLPKVVGEEAVFSMDLVKLNPNADIEREWLYLLLRHSTFADEVREEASGTTVLHLKPKHIEEWSATVPANMLRQQFSSITQAILEQIDALELSNARLRTARDLLLPRLMSGKIAV
jgi:type I restriction enzyme S subunit